MFAGELGYDLAATFQETFELGPLRVSDQYLPTYTAPEWLNEFESEEAFQRLRSSGRVHLQETRRLTIAQKVHDLLGSIPLTRVNDSPVNLNCPGIDELLLRSDAR